MNTNYMTYYQTNSLTYVSLGKQRNIWNCQETFRHSYKVLIKWMNSTWSLSWQDFSILQRLSAKRWKVTMIFYQSCKNLEIMICNLNFIEIKQNAYFSKIESMMHLNSLRKPMNISIKKHAKVSNMRNSSSLRSCQLVLLATNEPRIYVKRQRHCYWVSLKLKMHLK